MFGGTHQEDDWDTNAREDDSKFITEGCAKLRPADVKGAEHIKTWVGLRPGRDAVRLERETVTHKPTGRQVEVRIPQDIALVTSFIVIKRFQVIHNYGHGGSGITLFWGCAKDVYRLVKQVQSERNKKQHLAKL